MHRAASSGNLMMNGMYNLHNNNNHNNNNNMMQQQQQQTNTGRRLSAPALPPGIMMNNNNNNLNSNNNNNMLMNFAPGSGGSGGAGASGAHMMPHRKPDFSEGSILEERDGRSQRTVARFRIGPLLGQGGFAKCYDAKDLETGEHLALKVCERQKLIQTKTLGKLVTEIAIHRRMNHKNIVKFYRTFQDEWNVYIVLELCRGSTIMDLSKQRKRFSFAETQHIMIQTLMACQYMHQNNVIHRDLKLGNMMMDHEMNVKLGDYGLAAELTFDGERKKTICGTPNYIAPEILQGGREGHSFEVDVWSIGVILYTLLVGEPPFQTSDVKQTYSRIKQCRYTYPLGVEVPDLAKDLIQRILQSDPNSRPTLMEIRNHPFFQGAPNCAPLSLYPSRLRAEKEAKDLQNQQQQQVQSTQKTSTTSDLKQQQQQQQNNNNNNMMMMMQNNNNGGCLPAPTASSSARVPLRSIVNNTNNIGLPMNNNMNNNNNNNCYLHEQQHQQQNQPSSSRFAVPSHLASNKNNFVSPQNQEQFAVPMRPFTSSSTTMPTTSSASSTAAPPPPLTVMNTNNNNNNNNQNMMLNINSGRRGSIPTSIVEQQEKQQQEKQQPEPQIDFTGRESAIPSFNNNNMMRDSALPTSSNTKPYKMDQEEREHFTAVHEELQRTLIVDPDDADHNIQQQPHHQPLRSNANQPPTTYSNIPTPTVWVTDYADFSNRYGLAYRLSSGHTGCHFNDNTKLIWEPVTNRAEYYSRVKETVSGQQIVSDHCQSFVMDQSPDDLSKKTTLIKYFKSYIRAGGKRDSAEVVRCSALANFPERALTEPNMTSDMIYIKRWVATSQAMVFRLSNRVIQVCFFDKTEVILASESRIISFTDGTGIRRTMPLAAVNQEGGDLSRKLMLTKDILSKLIANREI